MPYALRDPRAVEELAKDVCAFANGGGGVLVLGIATRLVDDVEILDRIIPVDRASVDRDQFRKLIRERITPAPRQISVDWSDDQQGACVLYIDIPAQQAGTLFVVAAPVGKLGAVCPDTVAVPVREADGTHWLARTEIQRLLCAGVAACGMPTAETLSRLLHEAVAHSPSAPAAVRVGQGLPEWEREMREAYEELAGAGLGAPIGEAYLTGGPRCRMWATPGTLSRAGCCTWLPRTAGRGRRAGVEGDRHRRPERCWRGCAGGGGLSRAPGIGRGRACVGGGRRRCAGGPEGRQVGRRPPWCAPRRGDGGGSPPCASVSSRPGPRVGGRVRRRSRSCGCAPW
ncbi:RNA-binding domain-containing protein [Streptomyces collinus]|uniref:RNA-binding domain-containing protein n=1 Tax=Streptomyces collinus TaxID=42684 RepID=UPI0038235BBF